MKSQQWMSFLFAFALTQQVWAQSNLLRNAGFETAGSEAWEAYYWESGNPDDNGARWGSASRENWRTVSGSWIGVIRGTWAGQGNHGGFWQQVQATPGQRYRFTGFFFADGGGNKWTAVEQAVKVEFFDAALDMLTYTTLPLEHIGPNWVRKGFEATAPEDTAWVRVVIYATGAGGERRPAI